METTRNPSRIRYAFGQYTFEPASGELGDGQRTTALRPQVAKLLELLLRNANSTVSRDEIRHHLWGDNIVVEFEEGISACIRQLRMALNDGAAGTRYIQTISRRGYKFVYPVTVEEDGIVSPMAAQAAKTEGVPESGVARARRRNRWAGALVLLALTMLAAAGWLLKPFFIPATSVSGTDTHAVVAVLPFTNLSQDTNNSLLGASLASEVINLLGPIAPDRLSVIANTSSAHFLKSNETIRSIGQELGADYVLEGSVTQRRDTLHVSARLIRTQDQSYVWGDEYELDADYPASAYQQLTIKIATQVATFLAPDAAVKPLAFTSNRDAALAFQQGRYLIAQGDPEKALGFCQKAMGLDPHFAAAYACAANALLHTPGITHKQLAEAKREVARALELDASSAEAHLLNGQIALFYDWNPALAGTEIQDALRLNPGDAWTWQMYAAWLAATGETRQMQDAMETAKALDPVSVSVTNNSALVYFVAHEYAKAVENARINANLNSRDSLAQQLLILGLLGEGKYAEAGHQAAVFMHAFNGDQGALPGTSGDKSPLVSYFSWYSQRLEGQPADPYAAVFLADAYMHLGRADQAMRVLGTTVQQHAISTLIPFISVWPSLHPLCANPDFLALTRQLGQTGCLPRT